MKIEVWVAAFLMPISAQAVQPSFPAFASPDQKAKLNAITDRVDSGEYKALNDAAQLPAAVAVPYLCLWTLPETPAAQVEAAKEALRQVNGGVAYVAQDMAKTSADEAVPDSDFQVLGIIGTPDAAEAVAPYLFDFRTFKTGDGMVDDFLTSAEMALKAMNFPDAPSFAPDAPYSTQLIAWQKWAIAKGFIPKDWSARVGAPPWLLAIDNYGSTQQTGSAPKSLRNVTPAPVTNPSSTPTPPVVANPTTEPSVSPSHSVRIAFVAVVSALVLWGIISVFRRK